MARSKSRKKEKTKKRIYLRCRACGKREGLSRNGYCPTCREQNRLVDIYAKELKDLGVWT